MKRIIFQALAISAFILYLTAFNYGGCGGGSSASTGSSAPTANRAPLLTAIGDKTTAEGATLTFTPSATDPDGDALTYAAYSLPAGASFNAATHTFSWTPTYTQSGTYTVRFRVMDTVGLYAEEAITITITDVTGPTAPSDLVATVASTSQINLIWTDNSADEAGFKIERKIGAGDIYATITTTAANVVAYSDTGLSAATLYYYRVRSYNPAGNSEYSNEISAATTALSIAPTVINNYLTNVSHNTATFYGTLNPNGLATSAYFQYGTSTSYGNTTTSTSLGNGTASTNMSVDVTGLTPSTAYHFRLVAVNSSGTTYGTDQTFNTSAQPVPPSATTGSASNVTYNSVTLTGTANPNGFASTAYFQWGTTTAYGSSTQPIDIGSGLSSVNVADALIGIFANTTYHFRIVANNDSGMTFGNDQSFTTPCGPPTALTNPATDIDFASATLNGTVNPNGLSTDIHFEWGTTTGYGTSTVIQSVGSGTGYVNVTQGITGLTTNATYHFRLVAVNSSGTTNGLDQSFTAVTNVVWTELAGGEFHTMGLKNDGTLWAWGNNANGELGTGNYISKTTPTQVGTATSWSKVAVGSGYTIALKNNGTLWAWGDNAEGQIGLGSSITGANTPTQVGSATDWASIAAGGHSHSVAQTTTGDLYGWGDNSVGQLGLGDTTTRYTPTAVITDSSVSSIACGYNHTVAAKSDGSVWAWGDNSVGQLGLGDYISKTTPALVTSTGFSGAELGAGYGHTVAKKADGTLWTWGNNAEGELGLGDTLTRTTPTLITQTGWSDIEVGYKHTIGKKSDGTIWEWGDNSQGQLGLGDLLTRTGPSQVLTATDWSIIEAGWNHSIGIKTDGTLLGWGDNDYGQLGAGDTYGRNAPNQIIIPSINEQKLASGWQTSLIIKNNGELWGCGDNHIGQLGLGDTTNRVVFTRIGTSSDWAKISGGASHHLAIKTDGSLWAVGDNTYGELGLGDNNNRTIFTRVGSLFDWLDISCNNAVSVAIKKNGTLWAWGRNDYGQLGVGDYVTRYSPVQVNQNTDWVEVSAGQYFMIARKNNGTLWSWGSNKYGELGQGDTITRTTPTQIGTNTDWKKIACGPWMVMAIKNNGSLWVWGSNYSAELGLGNRGLGTERLVPTQLGTDTDWVTTTSYWNTLAIKLNGTLWGWGPGSFLGVPENYRTTPIQVGIDNDWFLIKGGSGFAVGLKNNGTIWSWGYNYAGQLGLGDTVDRATPTQVGQ